MRIGIIGGSIGGLAAARELRRLGAEVRVFERSPGVLRDRGAGIGLDAPTLSYLLANGLLDGHLEKTRHAFLAGDDRILWSAPGAMAATCWDVLYRGFRRELPDHCYAGGVTLRALETDDAGATALLSDGRRERFDLLVCADGVDSRARQILHPEMAPAFAGYVAVRGLIDEAALPGDVRGEIRELYVDALVRYLVPGGHVILYMVPGPDPAAGGLAPGGRRLNWVWYVNLSPAELEAALTDRDGRRRRLSVPPGMMAPVAWAGFLARGRELFTGAFAAVMEATARPFQQAIYSFMAPRLVDRRLALIGDAAHLCRPHVGSGSSLAIADAVALGEAVAAHGEDVSAALAAFEAERLATVAAMVELSVRMGEAHQGREVDWSRMTTARVEAWWAAMMAGGGIYFDARAGEEGQ